MLSRLSAAVIGATFLMSSAAYAQQPPRGLYASGAVGQSTFWDVDNVEFDFLAFFISGAIGYRASPNLRTEAELLYESAEIDNSSLDLEVTRATISLYYDLAPINAGGRGMTPYVGGGLGFANVEIIDDELDFTWHVEGGVSIPVAPKLDVVPGIRFEHTFLDDEAFGNEPDDELWITQLRIGARYSF